MEHVADNRELRTRNCIRVVPIEHTCQATVEALQEIAKEARLELFSDNGPSRSFGVDYTHRGLRLKR